MSDFCCSKNSSCSSDNQKSPSSRNFLWENSTDARPAFDFLPHFLRFYCCTCCHYGRRKSIDTISFMVDSKEQQQQQQQHHFQQQYSNENLKNTENNNFLCEFFKKSPTNATSTPILHFNMINNKSPPANGYYKEMAPLIESKDGESKQATPVSAKSTTYSQKSTASARSNQSYNEQNQHQQQQTPSPTVNESVQNLVKPSVQNRLEIEHENDDEAILSAEEEPMSMIQTKVSNGTELKRSASILSVQSKSESIKTQMDDTPPAVSRTQSMKSLAIEEDIEGTDSFVVVEETVEQQITLENINDESIDSPLKKSLNESKENENKIEFDGLTNTTDSKPGTAASCPRSPTIAELKILSRRNSMIKSMESLYERAPSAIKQDSLDTSTETSSQQSSPHGAPKPAQATVTTPIKTAIPIKPQHTPLKQKAKTSYFLRNHRRVSPVKQSIKMQQAELYPSTLQRFDKPREALTKTFDQLDSPNWEVIMQGLKSMVRLMRYHADYLETQMHMVCIQLTRSVRNLRSQVARAACQAATEIFSLKSKTLEQECDDLVCALLHRTADTNRFLRADATRALESMCDSLSPPKVLNILCTKGALHQNALVRTTTSKLLNRLAVRLGNDKLYTMARENRDKFFVTGANLLLEGSLETRSYAKALFRFLSDHPSFNRLVQEVIPQRTYRNIEKTLKSIQ